MKRTYEYDPTKIVDSGKDKMRFELGDTMVEGESATSALCDQEYEACLAMHPKNWKRAKLACLESICRRFAYEPDTSTGSLSLAFNARAKLWREDYEALKKELTEEGTTVPAYGVTPDGSRKQPYFYTGMMENVEAKDDRKLHVPPTR